MPPQGQVRIIGVTGHLLLNAEERQRSDRQVRAHCRELFDPPPACLRVLSGLAPGADLVVTVALLEEAAARGIPVALVALLPGTPEQLVDDWLQRSRTLGDPPSAAARATVERQIGALLRGATEVIDLHGLTPASSDPQAPYRALAALLAGVPDLLIAVHREGHEGQGGGTGEILAWRRRARPVPEAWRGLFGDSQRRDLLVIEPRDASGAGGASEIARRVRAHLRAADALSAYDLARAALERNDTAELRYLLLLSLAATGSAHAALDQYDSLAPPAAERDEDWLALRARLHKDLAFAGIDAEHNLRLAADEYAAAYARTGGSFSAINAATLRLLAGDRAAARTLAQAVLAHDADAGDETAAYFACATRAEAQLVLGDASACRAALDEANPLLRDDLTTRSRTRRQLARIAAWHGIDAGIVDAVEMPSVYLLDIDAQTTTRTPRATTPVAERLRGSPVYCVFDASEAALVQVDACQALGARLNLVLPQPRTQLLQHCRESNGRYRLHEVERCIDRSERVSALLGFLAGEQHWNRSEAQRLAQGLATVAAANLGVPLRRLSLDAAGAWQVDAPPRAVTADPPAERRMVGLIFTDMVGFRSYTDADVHEFWSTVMPAFADDVASIGGDALLAATWGDAVHVVTNGVQPAAALCLRLVETVNRLRVSGHGAIGRLRIRVGAHYAPAFIGFDPVQRQRTYYGSQLAFAASVEPIAPPGMAYVTEAFAAQLALEVPGRYQLEYAGELALAKRYGSFRLHSLRALATDGGS
jgi:hypothetical protein